MFSDNVTLNFKASYATLTKNVNAMQGALRNLNVDGTRTTGSFNLLSKTLNGLGFGVGIFAINKASQALSSFIQSSLDSIETINLFEVALKGVAEESDEFVTNLSKISGLDLNTLRQSVATFSLLASSMNFTEDSSQRLGKNLTKLAIDLSSLTNVGIEQVMGDLKSGIVGQTETVYKYGIDITEASLKSEALAQGITKSVDSMSQGEKMALRYSAMLRVTTSAQGDFAKTIETPANQLRILGERFVTLSRSIGNIFIPTLSAVLPYLNALVQVLIVLADLLSALVGYKADGVENTASSVSDLGTSITNANDDAGSLANTLSNLTTGFDELNVISDDTSSSSGDTDESYFPEVDVFSEYDGLFDTISQQADSIADKMLEWLGIEKTLGEDGTWNYSLEEGLTNLEKILWTVGLITGALALWKISPLLITGLSLLSTDFANFLTLGNSIGWLKTLSLYFEEIFITSGLLSKSLTFFKTWAAPIALIVGHFYTLWTYSETFRNGIERIKEVASGFWEGLSEAVKDFGERLAEALPETFVSTIVGWFETISEWVNTFLGDWGVLLSHVAMIVGIVATFGTPVGWILLAFEAISLAITAFGAISEETFDKIKNWWTGLGDAFLSYDGLFEAIEGIKDVMFNLVNGDLSWSEIGIEIIRGIAYGFEFVASLLFEPLLDLFNYIYDGICDLFGIHSPADSMIDIGTNIILGMVEGLREAFFNFTSIFSDIWDMFEENLSTIVSDISDYFDDELAPLFTLEYWTDFLSDLPTAFSNVFNNTFNGVINIVETAVNYIIEKINTLSWEIPDWVPGIGGNTFGFDFDPITIPRLARGGVLDGGQAFIAGEGGNSEVIGDYKGSTTVMPLENTGFVSAMYDAIYNAVSDAQSNTSTGSSQIIENVLQLDGQVIYKNQQKIASKQGVNFNLGSFTR